MAFHLNELPEGIKFIDSRMEVDRNLREEEWMGLVV